MLIHLRKLALGEDDGLRSALRQKAAMHACLATLTQRSALAAFEQPGEDRLAAVFVGWVFSMLGDVQRPLDWIFEQAVPIHRARMVDEDEAVFAGSWT